MKKSFRWHLIAILVTISFFANAQPALAVVGNNIIVNSVLNSAVAGDDLCTLREAITNADSDSDVSGGDCADGFGENSITFANSLGAATITVASTLPDISDGADILTINGGGDITIDGGGARRIFNVRSPLILENITLAHGYDANLGGAIYLWSSLATDGTLTILNSTLADNLAAFGGAVYGTNDTAITISGSTFTGNTATSTGGGGGKGAAIFNAGPQLIITGSTFTNNDAPDDSINGSHGYGGAIYNHTTGLSVSITDTTISDSDAYSGGGIYKAGGTLVAANSTFSGNTAALFGGGIDTEGGGSATYVTNSTFSDNTAGTNGGGIYVNAGTLHLANSILANSPSGYDCFVNAGAIGTDINNLIESNGPGVAACGTPSITSGSNLGPLADNGGPTRTFVLLAGSTAIDAGDDTTCGNAVGSPNYGAGGLDQRGLTRPQGEHCEIGAIEYDHLFADAPVVGKEWMEPWIIAFYNAGITTGCGASPLRYCPENNVTRAEMAVFLLRAKHGAGYAPPAASHYFLDVPVTGKEWMEPWIDQYYREGMTTGCGGGNYCPENNVTRAEMAVFVLRALHGGGYAPPAASGVFGDVPVTGKEWMEPWIIQFYNEGITTGCGGGNYCPENNVTRAEMAVFIGRAYGLYP